MKIRFLGAHNCETDGKHLSSLLIDDALIVDAGALTGQLPLGAYVMPAAILLTHVHYDHVRDIPAAAMNAALTGNRLHLFGTAEVRETLAGHLLNGSLYPKFLETPGGNPVIDFSEVEPLKEFKVNGYAVLPVPVRHSRPATGYAVTDKAGNTAFITGDTGPELAECWRYVTPDVLVIEVTMPDRWVESAAEHGHISPRLLGEVLSGFKEAKGYLPRVINVHMNPFDEDDIRAELDRLSRSLEHPITVAAEGMEVTL